MPWVIVRYAIIIVDSGAIVLETAKHVNNWTFLSLYKSSTVTRQVHLHLIKDHFTKEKCMWAIARYASGEIVPETVS